MRKTAGFTLVEIAIVLVIIGLLVGGVLGGRTLIRAAELRAIATEYDKYMASITSFKDRYRALPGDMNNATQFWGASANCPGTTAQGTVDGTTCNGDRDGMVERINTAGIGNEHFRAWQHLANAGLIEGVYNGVTGPANTVFHAVIGTNVPPSKLTGAGWTMEWVGVMPGDAETWAMSFGHVLVLGARSTDNSTYFPALSPEELWSLDQKTDDGKPGRGNIIAMTWPTCTNAANFSDLDTTYKLTVTTNACSIFFRNAF